MGEQLKEYDDLAKWRNGGALLCNLSMDFTIYLWQSYYIAVDNYGVGFKTSFHHSPYRLVFSPAVLLSIFPHEFRHY